MSTNHREMKATARNAGPTMTVPLRYVCQECGWRWTRTVRAPLSVNLDRPITVAQCPGCAGDEE